MNKLFFVPPLLLLSVLPAFSQLQETGGYRNQETEQKSFFRTHHATLKQAIRLFRDKDDLVSVIMVIPSGAVVDVISSDGNYLEVEYEGTTGYINAESAIVTEKEVSRKSDTARAEERSQSSAIRPPAGKIDRYKYLENKYDRQIARRIYEGKIWKGMDVEMVTDSWGSPRRINSFISNNNNVREEWYYKNTRLVFQNNVLVSWSSGGGE